MPDVFVEQPKKDASEKVAPEKMTTPLKNTHSSENHFHGLASFCEHPTGLSFRSQKENDSILLFARRHMITNLPWILTSVFLIFLPFFALFFLQTDLLSLPLSPAQITILTVLYYFGIVTYAFVNFLSWFYNIFIVTQKEIVDIDYSHLVYHDVAATNINLVEDVNYTQSGFIRSLFNFGDLFAQTAGGKENIEALAIPTPQRGAQIILSLIGKDGH